MVMSGDQNAGQYCNIKLGNESFEKVEEFKYLGTTLSNIWEQPYQIFGNNPIKYLGTTLSNQNSIHEEIRS